MLSRSKLDFADNSPHSTLINNKIMKSNFVARYASFARLRGVIPHARKVS